MQLNKRLMGLVLAGSLALASLPLPAIAAGENIFIVGNSGEEVVKIQQKLIELNYLQAGATGFYGSQTKQAVMNFQKDNGLKADGQAGPSTQKALLGTVLTAKQEAQPVVSGTKAINTNTARKGGSVFIYGNTYPEVKEIQQALKGLGYMTANPTGYFGKTTEEAVKAFQQDKGLKADGQAGPSTQQALLGKTLVATKAAQPTPPAAQQQQAQPKAEPQPAPAPESSEMVVEETGSLAVKSTDEIELSTAPITKPSPVYTNPNLMKKGSEGDSVTKLQNRLRELGYYTQGAVTGYYGNITTSAVRDFQGRNGLAADGVAGAATLAKLFSESAVGPEKTTPSSSKGQQTVDLAKLQLGKPYMWGGNGPASFDCSGLVCYVLKQQGRKEGRMSSYGMSTYSGWKEVSYANLIPGDLMFFDTRTDGSVPIGHVGIYMGGGQMIHASTSMGKVVISQVTSGYYKERFRNARRVF